jgi:hypothetical protein
MESRGVRLIDRMSQRAVGETLIANSGVTTVRYIDFIKSVETTDTSHWLMPLARLLRKATHTTERQQLLLYAAVVHAMIDTLDRGHSVTRDRPAIPGKLTKQTWRDLRYRVFGAYRTFVTDAEKIYRPPEEPGGRYAAPIREGGAKRLFVPLVIDRGKVRLLNHPYSVAA